MDKHKVFHGFLGGFQAEKGGSDTGNAKVVRFISAVRELSPMMTTICTQGSCYPFYELLKTVFPAAVPYYNDKAHVVTKIGDRFYDITGEVKPKNAVAMSRTEKKVQSQFVSDLRFTGVRKS